LVEALVVVTVIAVLLAAAVPTVSSVASHIRLTTYTSRFVAHLQLARSEAMKHGRPVVMCKSADGAACTTGGHWDQGWIIFHDDDNDAARAAGERIIEQAPALPSGWRVSGNQNVARYVAYHPAALTRMTSGAFQAGTITVCKVAAGAGEGRTIVLNAAGRPRSQAVKLANCE